MKNITTIASIFFVLIFVTQGCRKNKLKKDLYGKWSASISLYSSPDTDCICNYDEVIIEFKKNNAAYLNYTGPNGSKWSTPYECKWWIEKKENQKWWLLYILRYDTLSYPCHSICGKCPNDMNADSKTLAFPDTSIYSYMYLDDNFNTLELEIIQIRMDDMFFSNIHYLFTTCQRFHKVN